MQRSFSSRAGTARPALRVSLLFVAGFSLAFIALGFLAAWFGGLLSAYRPVLEAITGIVMIFMGAFLLNLLPTALMNMLYRERKLHLSGRWMGGAAPFGLGILFAAAWTPCIGPVLGSILFYAGASASLALGGVLLAIYALGFAVPFLLIGVGWASGLHALGWTRKYGRVVSLVSGGALMLVGLFFLSGQVSTFSIWAQHVMPPFFNKATGVLFPVMVLCARRIHPFQWRLRSSGLVSIFLSQDCDS